MFIFMFTFILTLFVPMGAIESSPPLSRLIVMPFRTAQHASASYSWLGRGLSFYLTAGLHSNGFAVRQDNETVALLNTHAIFFPYHMTKATAMRLAMDDKEHIIVLGEVGPDPKDKTRILVSGSVVDLKNYTRKKLPIFRGHIMDIFLVMEALLKSVITTLKSDSVTPANCHYPSFRLNPRNYEIFIKSLLLGEPDKKIELLEKARATDTQSDFLNLNLARAYFDKQQYPQSRALLAQIPAATKTGELPADFLLKFEKRGLCALLDYAEGNTDAALEAFILLEQDKYELFEVRHNLAVIYSQRKEYEFAENFFKKALDERSDPETWLYRVHNLLTADKPAEAELCLKTALKQFPDDSKLTGLFAYFLSKTPAVEELFELFQVYLPELVQSSERPGVSMVLKTPFNVTLKKRYSDRGEFREIESGSITGTDDTAIERLGALIETNSFLPKYYRLMAHLLLKKKDYIQAERHALAAVFLDASRENYLTLTVIYQATGKREKLKELEARLSQMTELAK